MKNSIYTILGLLALFILMPACDQEEKPVAVDVAEVTTGSESHGEYEAVHAAISDYLLGLYEVDSTRIEKSVDTSLRKIGYWFNKEDNAYRDNLEMSYNQLVSLAARWNKEGNRTDENSPKEIEIFDIKDKTASAKLTAEWGVDYFHLGKVNGQWKIMNVIWQSLPEE